MQLSNPPRIAIVADAHFHDIHGDYGVAGIVAAGRRLALRPFADTVKSTRIFNESGAALRFALDDIAARGIRHVVLLGDYTDDGQVETLRGLRSLLDEYRKRHGLRFFATPGNHDIFGMRGRHRRKRFLNGRYGTDLATSDPSQPAGESDDTVAVSGAMRCLGYPEGLEALPETGFFGAQDCLLWETPFGADGDPQGRCYDLRPPGEDLDHRQMDASYLVEPIPGIWLLMIDANVFVPVVGEDGKTGLADSTDAGWNAMLVHKRFILDWIATVAARAKRQDKTVLAFSHYPALDPLDGTIGDERAILGETSLSRRIPLPSVGDALIAAGIGVHFSGHLHINDTALQATTTGHLVNISVPSLVAFPAAYKILTVTPRQLAIETIDIGHLAMDPIIMDFYREEARLKQLKLPDMLAAERYGAFLSGHIGHLAGRRHLRREWPEDLADAVRACTLHDLALLAIAGRPLDVEGLQVSLTAIGREPDVVARLASETLLDDLDLGALSRIPVMTFLKDWYRVRMGSELGLDAIAAENLAAYRFVSHLFSGRQAEPGSAQAIFATLFRMFDRYCTGLPSRHFTIDLGSGHIRRDEG